MALDNSSQTVSPSLTVEVFPTYSNCEKILGLPTTVNFNGCSYLFHLAAATTTGTVDVKCPATKTIVINIGNGPFCQYTIGETNNQGLSAVTFDNVGTGSTREVKVTPTVTGITSTRTVPGFGCPAAGNKGVYEGTSIISGENGTGHVGVFVD